MKRTLILYIYVENPESSFLHILSSRYQVRLCHIVEEKNWEKEDWNLVVFQDDVYGVYCEEDHCKIEPYDYILDSGVCSNELSKSNGI